MATKLEPDAAKNSCIVPKNNCCITPNNKVNNNTITVNNTMYVTTPQEGFNNVYNIVDDMIRRINDNSVTAMG